MMIDKNGVLMYDSKTRSKPNDPAYDHPKIPIKGLNHGGKFGEDGLETKLLKLQWCHVISMKLIRDFWNKMQENGYWDCMAVYGSMVDVTQSQMVKLTAKMQGGTYASQSNLAEKILWAKWNLVSGPLHRSDEPTGELDDLRSRYGSVDDRRRILKLLNYGRQMEKWLAGMPSRKAIVRELIDQMKCDLNRRPVIKFDSEIWRVGSTSPQYDVTSDAKRTLVNPLWHLRGRIGKSD
ncbi:hypothetical protein AB1L42_21895 [Thalassoglobus sp. JC818]|uniref:hypothetical protein n=1 Tax=Thalassoglobus sp. JC818 TaxID=3232136 RepID=UPI0034579687